MRNILAGKKIFFKLLEVEDLKKRVKWLNDDCVQASLHYDYPTSLSRTKKWFEKNLMDRNRIEFSIFTKEKKEQIGFCGFLDIDIRARKGEHYMVIGEIQYWGGGYGTESYKLLTNYGFAELGLNRIYGYQNIDNVAAKRVVEKLGWLKEGTLRQDLYAHGKLYDRNVVSILKEDWISNPIYEF